MTQVAKLSANVQTADKGMSAGKAKNAKSLAEQFAGIMNQSTKNLFGSDFNFGKPNQASTTASDAAVRKEPPLSEYQKLGRGNRTITEGRTNTLSADKFSDKFRAAAGEVKDALKETLGVTEEEIEEAMSTLGLTAVDLLDPKNLILLAAQVSGNDDMTALLVSDSFQDMMQTVSGILSDFMQSENLQPDQFAELLVELSTPDETTDIPKDMTEALDEPVASSTQDVLEPDDTLKAQDIRSAQAVENAQLEKTQPEEIIADGGKQMLHPINSAEDGQPQDIVPTEEEEHTPSDITMNGATNADASKEEGSQGNAFAGGESGLQQLHDKLSDSNEPAMVFHPQTQGVLSDAVMPGTENVQPEAPVTMSYYEVEQLMQQVDGLARVFATDQSTTIEMQLNPENLGKLYLSVSEKQGAVTAQITASNEQVKETLQTQMVELRQTLQAQGIKVEAVEVTVATHEFEQNLDGSTNTDAQFEQNERQGEQSQGTRRNLNLNDAEDIPVDLTEAEALAAQMMRDNGNQVDFSA